MEKFELFNELYLIYKDFLNENNSDIFNLYYGENLSMQEIAEIKNITRSRVGAMIQNTQNKLLELEHICQIREKNNRLKELLNEFDIEKIKREIERIIE